MNKKLKFSSYELFWAFSIKSHAKILLIFSNITKILPLFKFSSNFTIFTGSYIKIFKFSPNSISIILIFKFPNCSVLLNFVKIFEKIIWISIHPRQNFTRKPISVFILGIIVSRKPKELIIFCFVDTILHELISTHFFFNIMQPFLVLHQFLFFFPNFLS